ncbi:unnamed protein product [Prorocentrum cordatum]|uniref:Uncharacterized protein n=1 Tax=Prorocentrum cordatum TaxID=2364126 RepID=A0ABN9S0V3_9DINO|nr:unnamed protein product [Polarella glacialis]
MFIGHYFTWIVAGLLYAVQLQDDPTNESVAPGPMAKHVAGINGLICIILAGWSTANPCMYEAGLALQSVLGSRWSTPTVTLGLGVVGTAAALFPVVVMKVLEALAFGGLLLLPVGVVLVVDTLVLPRLGLDSERCADEAGSTNWPAAAAWAVTVAVELPPVVAGKLAVFFAPLVGIPLAALLYVGLSCWSARRSAHSADAVASEAPPGVAPREEQVSRAIVCPAEAVIALLYRVGAELEPTPQSGHVLSLSLSPFPFFEAGLACSHEFVISSRRSYEPPEVEAAEHGSFRAPVRRAHQERGEGVILGATIFPPFVLASSRHWHSLWAACRPRAQHEPGLSPRSTGDSWAGAGDAWEKHTSSEVGRPPTLARRLANWPFSLRERASRPSSLQVPGPSISVPGRFR